jgi:hypothetical protein
LQTSLFGGVRRLFNILIEGYATLNRRLWVLVIPIGLDLYLWLGPHISLRGLLEGVIAFSRQVPQADPQTTAALQAWAEQSNLAGLIASPLTSPLTARLTQPASPGYAALPWVSASPLLVLLAGLATAAVVLLFWSLYLLPLADLVRGSGEGGVQMLRRVPAAWGRMALYCGIVVLGGLALGLAFTVGAALAQLLSAALALLLITLVGVLLAWGVLLLFMVPYAILLSGVGPLRAMAYSVRVARSRLWSAIGFLLLTALVQSGTTVLWDRLASQPVWVLLGIIANGYIVGGLAAAGLVFYREGLRDWLARGAARMDKAGET